MPKPKPKPNTNLQAERHIGKCIKSGWEKKKILQSCGCPLLLPCRLSCVLACSFVVVFPDAAREKSGRKSLLASLTAQSPAVLTDALAALLLVWIIRDYLMMVKLTILYSQGIRWVKPFYFVVNTFLCVGKANLACSVHSETINDCNSIAFHVFFHLWSKW